MNLKKSLSNRCHPFLLSLMTSCLPDLFLRMDTYSMTLIISSIVHVIFFGNLYKLLGGRGKEYCAQRQE